MNWYTSLIPDTVRYPTYFDGKGVLVCDNPIECWEYTPSTTHSEIWRVLPTGPVLSGEYGGVGKAEAVLLLRRIPAWELYSYSSSRYACVTTDQKLISGGNQKIFGYGTSTISVQDGCYVRAWDGTLVSATDDVVVEAWNEAQIILAGRSRCYAHDAVQVILLGPDAAVTFPSKSKVKVTLIDANPKNVLSNGRYFTADKHQEWLSEIEEKFNEYREDSFWDRPVSIRPSDPVSGDNDEDAREHRAHSGRAGLAALFGEADEADGLRFVRSDNRTS